MIIISFKRFVLIFGLFVITTSEAKSSKTGFTKSSFCSEIKNMTKSFIYISKDKMIMVEKYASKNIILRNNHTLLLVKSINHRIPPELNLLNAQEIAQCTLDSHNCKFEKNILLRTHSPTQKDYIELKERQKIFIDRFEIKTELKIKSQDFINFNKIYNLEITTPQKHVLSIQLSTKIYLQDKKLKNLELKTHAEIVLSEYDKPQELIEQGLKIHLNSDRYKNNIKALVIKEFAKHDLFICN